MLAFSSGAGSCRSDAAEEPSRNCQSAAACSRLKASSLANSPWRVASNLWNTASASVVRCPSKRRSSMRWRRRARSSWLFVAPAWRSSSLLRIIRSMLHQRRKSAKGGNPSRDLFETAARRPPERRYCRAIKSNADEPMLSTSPMPARSATAISISLSRDRVDHRRSTESLFASERPQRQGRLCGAFGRHVTLLPGLRYQLCRGLSLRRMRHRIPTTTGEAPTWPVRRRLQGRSPVTARRDGGAAMSCIGAQSFGRPDRQLLRFSGTSS